MARRRKKRVHKGRLFMVVVFLLVCVFAISKVVSFISPSNKKDENIKKETTETIDASKIITIAVDAAKGGDDKGVKSNGGQYEKDINLEIANQIVQRLSAEEDITPIAIRDTDKNMSLSERAKKIKDSKADILISVRVNAATSTPNASGMETYYIDKIVNKSIDTDTKGKTSKDGKSDPTGSNSDNTAVGSADTSKTSTSDSTNDGRKNGNLSAQSGSSSDKSLSSNVKKSSKPNSDSTEENSVTVELSNELAKSIQLVSLSFVDMSDRGAKPHTFDILYYMNRPSVIVQPGFVTNLNDQLVLDDREKLDSLANGISEGILQFVDKNKNEILSNRVKYN